MFYIPGKTGLVSLLPAPHQICVQAACIMALNAGFVLVDCWTILIGMYLVEFKSSPMAYWISIDFWFWMLSDSLGPGFVLFAQAAIDCGFHALHCWYDGLSATGLYRIDSRQFINDVSLKRLLNAFFALLVCLGLKFLHVIKEVFSP